MFKGLKGIEVGNGCCSEKREGEHVTLPESLLLTQNPVLMRGGDLVYLACTLHVNADGKA